MDEIQSNNRCAAWPRRCGVTPSCGCEGFPARDREKLFICEQPICISSCDFLSISGLDREFGGFCLKVAIRAVSKFGTAAATRFVFAALELERAHARTVDLSDFHTVSLKERHMYLLFAPASVALLFIGFIQLREQFGTGR